MSKHPSLSFIMRLRMAYWSLCSLIVCWYLDCNYNDRREVCGFLTVFGFRILSIRLIETSSNTQGRRIQCESYVLPQVQYAWVRKLAASSYVREFLNRHSRALAKDYEWCHAAVNQYSGFFALADTIRKATATGKTQRMQLYYIKDDDTIAITLKRSLSVLCAVVNLTSEQVAPFGIGKTIGPDCVLMKIRNDQGNLEFIVARPQYVNMYEDGHPTGPVQSEMIDVNVFDLHQKTNRAIKLLDILDFVPITNTAASISNAIVTPQAALENLEFAFGQMVNTNICMWPSRVSAAYEKTFTDHRNWLTPPHV